MYSILYGLIGLAVGSFLNVVIDRAPEKRSLLGPPSHCPWCGRRLTASELVPVYSYLVLRGHCHSCGASIPRRTLWVELATGLLFAFLWQVYGPTVQLALGTVYSCILLVIMVVDLEHKLVLNVISLPAIALALLVSPIRAWVLTPPFSHYGFMGLFLGGGGGMPTFAQISMFSQLLGGVTAFAIFFLIWFITPRGMGAGDVKLAAFAGLVTAFPGALVAVFGSFILGGVVSAALLLSGKGGRKTAIPFAPFLVITTFLVMIYGDALVKWYVHYLLR